MQFSTFLRNVFCYKLRAFDVFFVSDPPRSPGRQVVEAFAGHLWANVQFSGRRGGAQMQTTMSWAHTPVGRNFLWTSCCCLAKLLFLHLF